MSFMVITSSKNPQVKWLKSLNQKKTRNELSLFYLEGKRLVQHAIDLHLTPTMLFIRENTEFESSTLLPHLILAHSVFDELADTTHSQGVIGVFSQQDLLGVANEPSDHVVVLDRIQDPGNLGTIIRTCDALGLYDIYMLSGCVDAFSQKVLRSTMGSIFKVRLHVGWEESALLKHLRSNHFELIGTALEDSVPLDQVSSSKQKAFFFGNEGSGMSRLLLEAMDIKTHIPMKGSAESLNVGIAAGIVLYTLTK
jgi:TrmH family RNA methyltransferase